MKLFKFFILFLFSLLTVFSQDNPVHSLAFKKQPAEIIPLSDENEVVPLSLIKYDAKKINFDPLQQEINYTVLSGLGAVYLGVGVAVHIYQANAWWSKDRRSFHFANDWEYSRWQDKLGHFYANNLLAHAFTGGLEAGNVRSDRAHLWGSIAALAFETYVEIQDGFGAQWGFSPGDAMANLLGVSYFYAQYRYPYLKNFLVKLSYYPSEKYLGGGQWKDSFDDEYQPIIIDDYEGQKYWISMRMKNILPDAIAKYWPSFLNLAVGMGVTDLDGSGGGRNDVYISLDFDAESIPLYGPVWEFVKSTLNYIKFPMPGIRINNNAAFFMFLF